jgi:hypothetical protein
MDVYDHPNGKADVKETLRKAYFTSAPDVKGDHARKAKKEPETASPARWFICGSRLEAPEVVLGLER